MEKKEIFRKVSLERLSSPDQLDLLARVTTPTGWYALIVLAMILAMALIWGFLGNIPIVVRGQGILLSQDGITNVVSLGSGQVTEVVVRSNDYVQRGQVIARIAQPELFNQLSNARNELEEARSQYQRMVEFAGKDNKFQGSASLAQKQILQTSITTLERQAVFLKSQLSKQEQLLQKELVVASRVEATRGELAATLQQIESQKVKLAELSSQSYSQSNRSESSLKESEFRINALQRNIALMEDRMTYDSRVVCKTAGKVIEVKVSAGSVVGRGTPVISVESQGRLLKAFLYVPASEGKKVKPGMEIDIVTTAVKKEEYGSVLGLISYVSDYPSTYQGMLQVLENENLTQTLSINGAPYAVEAELIPDSKTISGYKWSSGKGPSITLQAGTMCVAEIIVEHKRPVTYVIPFIKNKLGL